jgi:hypothetical protein
MVTHLISLPFDGVVDRGVIFVDWNIVPEFPPAAA